MKPPTRQRDCGETADRGARGRSAFSLIEILLAVLILGGGMAGMTAGIAAALRSSKDSERLTMAALIAAGRLETLRAEGFWVEGEEEAEESSFYRWRQTITETSVEGLFEVQVEVEFSATGEALYELRTYLFDPPAYSTTDEAENRREWERPGASGRSRL